MQCLELCHQASPEVAAVRPSDTYEVNRRQPGQVAVHVQSERADEHCIGPHLATYFKVPAGCRWALNNVCLLLLAAVGHLHSHPCNLAGATPTRERALWIVRVAMAAGPSSSTGPNKQHLAEADDKYEAGMASLRVHLRYINPPDTSFSAPPSLGLTHDELRAGERSGQGSGAAWCCLANTHSGPWRWDVSLC